MRALQKVAKYLLCVCLVMAASSTLKADLLLSVDFDTQEDGIQSTVTLEKDAVLRVAFVLTGDELLAQYKFSVQFDRSALQFLSREDPLPQNWLPLTSGGKPIPIVGETYVRRFDGQNFDGSNDVDPLLPGLFPYILGFVEFKVLETSAPTGNLITPGLFEEPIFDFGTDVPGDNFWGLDANGNIRAIPGSRISFSPGGITAVPEPGSLLLLSGGWALLAISRRLQKAMRRNAPHC